ncbi:unnamed protein product [marine sediment metagenome]|uniref:Uncharacterized protein n=1 Tax=marine sediment metagenome TaxID=412755 RepID=X0U5A8_9ZZZZ
MIPDFLIMPDKLLLLSFWGGLHVWLWGNAVNYQLYLVAYI